MNETPVLSRRKLLRATAAGTAAAGLASVARAGAIPAKLVGIHIHGSLRQTAGPGGMFTRLIDVTVFGNDADLSGAGWDANPETPGAPQPGAPDRTQCYFTQRGSVTGDTVRLMGRNLFWHTEDNDGNVVTTEANLATGQIRWSSSFVGGRLGTPGTVVFEGVGVVGRI